MVGGTITKPKLTIVGNSEYSIDDINTLSKAFTGIFDVETGEYEEFSEVALGALLIFTLQGVTSGFLQAIGDKIWLDICEQVSSFTASKATGKADELEFKVTPKMVHFRISSQDKDTVKEALKQFPKALEWAERNRSGAEPYLEFDNRDGKWKE